MLTESSETLVLKFLTTRRHIPEASDLQCHRCDNFGYELFQCLKLYTVIPRLTSETANEFFG